MYTYNDAIRIDSRGINKLYIFDPLWGICQYNRFVHSTLDKYYFQNM